MSPDLAAKVRDLRARGYAVVRIAQMLGVHHYSVRWVLAHDTMLERAKKKRRAMGSGEYKCGKCHEIGHNRRTCKKS